MEIIIHIGLHKTGSTLIQKSFLKNYDKGVRQGLLFPKTGFVDLGERHGAPGTSAGHDLFVKAALSGDRVFRNCIMASLSDEIARTKPQKVFISAENFTHHLLGDLSENTRSLLESMGSVRILVTLRNPYDWMESYYRDRVTSGWEFETLPISEFIKKHSSALNFCGTIRNWEHAFGANNMAVMVYGPEIKKIGLTNAFRRYLGFCGELESEDSIIVNQGPANDFVASALAFNRKVLPTAAARRVVTEFKAKGFSEGARGTLLQPKDVALIERIFESYNNSLNNYKFLYGGMQELHRKPENFQKLKNRFDVSEEMIERYNNIRQTQKEKIYGLAKYMLSKMPIKFQVMARRNWMKFSSNKYKIN
jgi:hypothetical protein